MLNTESDMMLNTEADRILVTKVDRMLNTEADKMFDTDADRILVSPYYYEEYTKGSLYVAIQEAFQKWPHRLAMIDTHTGEKFTYEQLEELVERTAFNLHRFGVGSGDVIALFSSNTWQYVVMILVSFRLAAIPCFISFHSRQDEINAYLEMCSAKYMFAENCQAGMAVEAAMTTDVKYVFTSGSHLGCIGWDIISRAVPSGHCLYPLPEITRDDTAAYLFSSGTSGSPKPVETRHCTLVEGMASMGSEHNKVLDGATIIFQPFAHAYGLGLVLSSLIYGYYSLIMARFNIETYINLISEYRVTHLQVVPPILVALCKSPLVNSDTLSGVRLIKNGAAPMSAELEQMIRSKLAKDVIFRHSYGMTEGVLFCLAPVPGPGVSPVPSASVGLPYPGCKIKIVDQSTGEILGPNKQGEVQVHAPFRMKGYLKRPEATAAVMDEQGWIHSGDIGYYDENGYIFVVDRMKELIKYNSFQVSPSELEGLLFKHPLISDVGVTSVPCEVAGELPQAWVVRKDASLTEDIVKKYVAEKAARYKHLKGGVRFVDSIPKTASGKILRRIMKDIAWTDPHI